MGGCRQGKAQVEGYASQGGTNGLSNGTSDVIIHESFHLLGFDERYADVRAILDEDRTISVAGTHPSFDGDVMQGYHRSTSASPCLPLAEINVVHHYDVVDFAYNNREKINNGPWVLSGQSIDDTNRGANPTSNEKIDKIKEMERPKPTPKPAEKKQN